MYSDAAYDVCRDGYSSTGNMFSVGGYNAPFFVSAKTTCPMTAEYYAAHHACTQIVHFSAVYRDLGWPILELVTFICIQLVVPTQVPVKSRPTEQWYHYIRTL